MKINTKSWNKILSFYKSLKDEHGWNIQPMIDLALMIQSQYKSGIYGYTSHATLYIGQHPVLDENNAVLKISHKPNESEVNFSYKGDNSPKYTWNKSFPEKQIKVEFNKFIKETKWII